MALITAFGFEEIRPRLKDFSEKTGIKMERALMKAGRYIQRESQRIVPVLTTNLKGSATTRKQENTSGLKTIVLITYGAAYAIYVHENLRARHKPGKQAKFLTSIFTTKEREIKAIIEAALE